MFKNFFFAALATAATLFSSNANAAALAPEQTQLMIPTMLRAGTQVFLELSDEFNATEISVGNAINFTVRRDVTVNGRVVIAAGSPATGTIRKVAKACNGKCSKITFTVESAQAVDGQTIPLDGKPHVIEASCCNGSEAKANIGTLLTAGVRNDRTINS